MPISKSERENIAIAGGTAVVGSTLGWTTAPIWAGAIAGTKAGAIIAIAAGPVGIGIGVGLLCIAGISALRNKNNRQ